MRFGWNSDDNDQCGGYETGLAFTILLIILFIGFSICIACNINQTLREPDQQPTEPESVRLNHVRRSYSTKKKRKVDTLV